MRYGGPAHSRLAVALSRGPPHYPAPQTRAMTIELVNPADLPPQATYTQVVVAAGTAMVVIAGQEPDDVHGDAAAAGDLAGQARQVYANLGRALTAAGARPDQVAKLTSYVAAAHPDTCRSSSKPGWSYPGTTSPPARSSARRGPAGPARVPHRGRRDRGEVRIRQRRENRHTSQTPGPCRASTGRESRVTLLRQPAAPGPAVLAGSCVRRPCWRKNPY
jgi:enamine deaminase RidA (YjgF/YER057c/UK114 family)